MARALIPEAAPNTASPRRDLARAIGNTTAYLWRAHAAVSMPG